MRSRFGKVNPLRAILLLCLLIGSIPAARAQPVQDGSRRVAPGQTVVGVIDAEHLTQMYIFTQGNAANEVARLQNSGVLALSLAVLDMAGSRLSVLPPLVSGGEASLSWPTSEGTSYYLLVFPAEAPAGGAGSFRLTLSGVPAIAPPATQPEAIPMGGTLQINLAWQAGARLSLEVRDPQGQSLHWRNPQTANGGSFTGSSDPLDCAVFSPHTQTQTATWNAAVSGSYEILVHYVDGCETSIPFTLRARLGTSEFPMLSSTLPSADSTFVGGFVVGTDGRAAISVRNGIVSETPILAIATADLVANAQPLPAAGAQGHISSDQPYYSYQFEGTLGTVLSAAVTRTSGSLDTLLVLMDSNGNLIALNDDASDVTTDSAISEARLRHSGSYLLVVTRYAQAIGATEGDFALTVSGAGD